MSKIVFEKRKKSISIINKLSYPETINERIVNAIASGTLEGFIPVVQKQKRKEIQLVCDITGLLSFNDYFQGVVSRKMFLYTVDGLVKKIKMCERNMINPNNLDFQKDRIFVDPQTKALSCVFWPIVNNQLERQPYLFLKQLPYDITFSQHEDTSYIKVYTDFFTGLTPFSINSFDRMIQSLLGNSSQPIHTPSEQITNEQKKQEKKQIEKQQDDIEYDPFSNSEEPKVDNRQRIKKQASTKMCSCCGTQNTVEANFCIQCGNSFEETNTPNLGGTTVLGDSKPGKTTVLGSNELDVPVYPFLIRNKNYEKIQVDKPVFRIGKEKQFCDFFISDNNAISRSHANIITRDRRYYIVDLNSTNKTYVDSRAIPVDKEIEIFSGTEIRLANEDFRFAIEN